MKLRTKRNLVWTSRWVAVVLATTACVWAHRFGAAATRALDQDLPVGALFLTGGAAMLIFLAAGMIAAAWCWGEE